MDKDVGKLHNEIVAELGEIIHGVNSNGVISWHDGHPAGDEDQRAQAVIAAHDPIDHSISPSLAFLKGDDTHSVTLNVATDPTLPAVELDVCGELLTVALVEGRGSFDVTSDTPGTVIVVTGRDGAMPGAEARIYVI